MITRGDFTRQSFKLALRNMMHQERQKSRETKPLRCGTYEGQAHCSQPRRYYGGPTG